MKIIFLAFIIHATIGLSMDNPPEEKVQTGHKEECKGEVRGRSIERKEYVSSKELRRIGTWVILHMLSQREKDFSHIMDEKWNEEFLFYYKEFLIKWEVSGAKSFHIAPMSNSEKENLILELIGNIGFIPSKVINIFYS